MQSYLLVIIHHPSNPQNANSQFRALRNSQHNIQFFFVHDSPSTKFVPNQCEKRLPCRCASSKTSPQPKPPKKLMWKESHTHHLFFILPIVVCTGQKRGGKTKRSRRSQHRPWHLGLSRHVFLGAEELLQTSSSVEKKNASTPQKDDFWGPSHYQQKTKHVYLYVCRYFITYVYIYINIHVNIKIDLRAPMYVHMLSF